MKEVFDTYGKYYDLINSGKDYDAETEYIVSLLRLHCPDAKHILELGCGTGVHAYLLSKRGYMITGVDQSAEMLGKARLRNDPNCTEFVHGDIRYMQLDHSFDAVISLFHVMSYLVSREDMLSALKAGSSHLKKGGVFLFDCWHGPAVIQDPPVSRKKVFENDSTKVDRISYPEWDKSRHVVKVSFDISVLNKESAITEQFRELHQMRYWFPEEIRELAEESGLTLFTSHQWLKQGPLNDKDWNALYVLKKK